MADDDDFGDFEESDHTPVNVDKNLKISTVKGHSNLNAILDSSALQDDDDEFGDFGGADEVSVNGSPMKTNPTATAFSVSALTTPVSAPAVPQNRPEEPDILSLSNTELEDLISSSWRPPTSLSSHFSTEAISTMHSSALSHLRVTGLAPHGVDPESILGYGGIPMTRVPNPASTSSSAFSASAHTVQVLGSVYVPIAK
jgi:hypothetical protein